MNKIIGIVSGKGGVGKTTLCANIAFSLAASGKKVIAVDGDISLKNLDIPLGMTDKTAYDLSDVISGACTADGAIAQHDDYPGLYFISAPQSVSAVPDPEGLGKLCEELRREYDFVLIDAPAGVGEWVRGIIRCCDECVVVATPDLTSLRDAQRVVSLIADNGDAPSRLVINKVSPPMINRGYLQNIDDMMDSVSLPLLGLVPTDDSIVIYSNGGKPVYGSKSVCSGPFCNIAMRLCGKNVPLDRYWRKNKNRQK